MAIRREQTITFKTNDNVEMPVTFSVNDGEDDFELWKKQPGNADKTLEDYKEFKSGAAGSIIVSAEVTEKIVEV